MLPTIGTPEDTTTAPEFPAPGLAELHRYGILIVDDEAANVAILRRLVLRAGYERLAETTDPRQALALFREFQPDIVLLDLHMPGLDGFGVLKQLEPEIAGATYLPIVMLTGDATAAAKQRALSLGAKDFVVKPFDSHEVVLRINNMLETRLMHLRLQQQNQWLEKRVQERTHELGQAQIETLDRLARAAEFRDDDTGQHTRRVGRVSAVLARKLGMDETAVGLISLAAPLHDVGKIGIPDQILLKPGRLSAEEFATVKTHTRIGAEILSGGRTALLRMAEQIALGHHERWDGGGYPDGRQGEAIPLAARIVAVADFFDALSHGRPYRGPWPCEEVVAEIEKEAGRHFDPRVVEIFLQLPHRDLM
jgi:putative two-component system response regulator